MNKYYFIPLSLLLCFLCSGCFATDSSVKKMEQRISVMEKDMAELKAVNEKLKKELAHEEKNKREAEEKLGKEIKTLKKEQEKLKAQVRILERNLSNSQSHTDYKGATQNYYPPDTLEGADVDGL